MNRNQILVKTPKGQDEIRTRAHKLTPRLRRLLIMVDGRSSVTDTLQRLQALGDDLEEQLAELLAQGFLAPAGAAAAVEQYAESTVAAVIPQFAEFNLDKAKGFARYVVCGALGPVGARRAERLDSVSSVGELRVQLDELRDVLPKLMPKRQAEQVWKQLEPLMLSLP